MPTQASKSITIKQIYDVDDQEQRNDLREGVWLCIDRLPEDECYDPNDLFRLIENHLAGNFGPHRPSTYWKGYCFVAKRKTDVVGMLLSYADLQSNFSFLSFIVAAKPPRSGDKHSPDHISQDLLEQLKHVYEEGTTRQLRLLSEVDHPALANNEGERKDSIARIKLFAMAAEYLKLPLRVIDLDYVQPQLDSAKDEKHMLLLYAARNLPLALSKEEVSEVLTWIYTKLYSEDIIEEPHLSEKYGAYLRQLLKKTLEGLPIRVPLLLPEQIYKPSDFGCHLESKKLRTGSQKLAQSSGVTDMISILFLAADPTDASRLRLGEEFREIQEKLKMARLRDRFKLELPQLSVRPPDISQALLDTQPQIVHFSGHGISTGALCFEDQSKQSHLVQPEALAALFEQFSNQVKCVILNACYSDIQAKAIAEHVENVIGMNQAIGDKAAIAFAIGFYQALGAGRTIEEAYRLGCVQIRLQDIAEYLTPVLIRSDKAA